MSPKKKRKNPSLTPILLISVGAVLLVTTLVVLAFSGSTAPETAQNIPHPNIERVSLADARSAVDSGQAVLVDVRDNISFQEARIPGAVNIPAGEIQNRLNELDPNDWIITYCT